mgnify:CR=1 FL=1|jgi:phosphoglycerate dehydrogenase-like enzyme
MKILISDPLSEIGLDLLRDSGFECIYLPKSDNAELESIIKVIDAWIIRSGTKIDYNLIKVSKNLKAIGRAGVDNINLDAATRKGNLNALAVIRLDGRLLDDQLEEIKNIKNISSVSQINTNYSLN